MLLKMGQFQLSQVKFRAQGFRQMLEVNPGRVQTLSFLGGRMGGQIILKNLAQVGLLRNLLRFFCHGWMTIVLDERGNIDRLGNFQNTPIK